MYGDFDSNSAGPFYPSSDQDAWREGQAHWEEVPVDADHTTGFGRPTAAFSVLDKYNINLCRIISFQGKISSFVTNISFSVPLH